MRIVGEVSSHIIEEGWSGPLAEELVQASREPLILQNTPGDAIRRFSDVDAAHKWHSNPDKNPKVYSLREGQSRKLGGIAWFRHGTHPESGPGYPIAFGIRLYESSRGQGLSYPFASAAHEDFIHSYDQENPFGIWLETDQENVAALRLYEKLGYATLKLVGNRLLMVTKAPSIERTS